MYIWRGQNRRDRRGHLLAGRNEWTTPSYVEDGLQKDERTRIKGESEHVAHFIQKVRTVLYKYLETAEAKEEISLVAAEMDRMNMFEKDLTGAHVKPSAPSDGIRREIMYEVFRKFDVDRLDALDRHEFRVMLSELNIPMKEKQFLKLVKLLDTEGEDLIAFEAFFDWYQQSARDRRKCGWHRLSCRSTGYTLSDGLKKHVREIYAQNMINDVSVYQAEIEAVKEYRVAHPPAFPCKICRCSFVSAEELAEHEGDVDYHTSFSVTEEDYKKKLRCMETVLNGPAGRRLTATRIGFSRELAPQAWRSDSTAVTDFRPFISDTNAYHTMQLVRGMLVQGMNPTAGLRTAPERLALTNQYAISLNKSPAVFGNEKFVDLNLALKHADSDLSKVDFAIVPTVAGSVDVRFMWRGFAADSVQLTGDFLGWKVITLFPDPIVGKCFSVQTLTPGKYFYNYIIDGKEMLDPDSSTAKHPVLNKVFNSIIILNPPASHGEGELLDMLCNDVRTKEGLRYLRLRNSALFDGGAWTLASMLQKSVGVRSIDLSFNGISDAGIQALCAALPAVPTLQSLYLAGNGFGVQGIRYLAKALGKHPGIQTLDLSQNRLGDDGAESICDLVVHHASLQTLQLDSNFIGDDGLSAFSAALERNRSLTSLSLRNNDFTEVGLGVLTDILRRNGSIKELNLASNNFGSKGAVHVGEMLATNRSITSLDLTSIRLGKDLMTGVQGLRYGIAQNKSLCTLNLSKNKFDDSALSELMTGFSSSTSIVEVDLSYNSLSKFWFLSTADIEKLPVVERPTRETLRQLLDRNRRKKIGGKKKSLASKSSKNSNSSISGPGPETIESAADDDSTVGADNATAVTQSAFPTVVPATDAVAAENATGTGAGASTKKGEGEGYWNPRGRWKEGGDKNELRSFQRALEAAEEARVMEEQRYVEEMLGQHIEAVKAFLESKFGENLMAVVAKLMRQHLRELGRTYADIKPLKSRAASPMTVSAPGDIPLVLPSDAASGGVSGNPSAEKEATKPTPEIDMNNKENPGEETKKPNDENKELESSSAITANKKKPTAAAAAGQVSKFNASLRYAFPIDSSPRLFRSTTCSCRKDMTEEASQLYIATHKVVVARFFKRLGATSDKMLIEPEKLQQFYQYLLLPLTRKSTTQRVLESTIVERIGLIGFNRTYRFLLENSRSLAWKAPFSRSRFLMGAKSWPLREDAREIIMENVAFAMKRSITKYFRLKPGNAPKFVCNVCGTRFTNQQAYDFHITVGERTTKHRVHATKLKIFDAQLLFLRHAKFMLTNRKFPAYFSLVPELKMPKDYYPQVFDSVGPEGRPIGCISHNMIVRAEDVFDDYFLVNFKDTQGWTRFRLKGTKLLIPACSEIKKFSWKELVPLARPEYYRVKEDLPAKIELKVRFKPTDDGEICGHLKPGQVVECRAEFGRWLQIRYNEVEAAWVQYKTLGGGVGSTIGAVISKGSAKDKDESDDEDDPSAAAGRKQNMLSVEESKDATPTKAGKSTSTKIHYERDRRDREREKLRDSMSIKGSRSSNLATDAMRFGSPSPSKKTNKAAAVAVVDDAKTVAVVAVAEPADTTTKEKEKGKAKEKSKSNKDKTKQKAKDTVAEKDKVKASTTTTGMPTAKAAGGGLQKPPEQPVARDEVQLLYRLHASIQPRMEMIVTESPYDPMPEDVEVDPIYEEDPADDM